MAYTQVEVPRVKDRLDRLHYEGLPFFISRPLNGGFGPAAVSLISGGVKPKGTRQVHLITKIAFAGTSDVASPAGDYVRLLLYNAPVSGGLNLGNMRFYLPYMNVGAGALAGPVNNFFVWEPRHPIMVHPDWRLEAVNSATLRPTVLMLYGIAIEEHEAHALGILPAKSSFPGTVFGNYLINGDLVNSTGPTQLFAPLSGSSVELTDVFVEMMPTTDDAYIDLQQGDGSTFDTVLRWHHMFANGQLSRSILKPRIFTDDNYGLYVTADANAIGRCTINIMGRYVKNEDKPGDSWWSFVDPTLPSNSVARTNFTDRDGNNVAAYSKGHQQVIEGFHVSAANNSTGGNCLLGIGTGPAGGSQPFVNNDGSALQPTIPVLGLSEPYEQLTFSMDEINLPLVQQAGWVTFAQLEDAGILGGANDVQDSGFTIWGRTRPTRFKGLVDAAGVYMGG